MALNNQSGCLSGLGRREEALAAVEEAAGIYRQLAQARPDAFLPDLAMALNNQSAPATWGGGRRPWPRPRRPQDLPPLARPPRRVPPRPRHGAEQPRQHVVIAQSIWRGISDSGRSRYSYRHLGPAISRTC